jgi:xyloglucan fucosyltransferase
MWAKKKFCNIVGNMLTPPRGAMGGQKFFVVLACSSLLLCSLMVLLSREDFSPADEHREKLVEQAAAVSSSEHVPPAEVVSSAAAAALQQQHTGIDPPEPLAVVDAAPSLDDQVVEPGVSLDQEIVAPADQSAPSPADHQPAASPSPIDQPDASRTKKPATAPPIDQPAAASPTDQQAATSPLHQPATALPTDQPAAASAPTHQPTVAAALEESGAASSTDQPGGTRGISGGDRESSTTTTLPAAAEALIRELRAVAMRVNGGEPVQPLSEIERNEWHQKNPCISREKLPLRYAARKFVKHVEDASPAAWDAVFREYEILHRTCTTKVQDISLYFLERDTSTPAGCNYLLCNTYPESGLGNQIYITASCVIYAVLTQRVLLLPSTNTLPDILCEPFEGSSWKVNEERIGFPVPSAFWLSTEQFLSEVDRSVGSQDPATTTVHATDMSMRYYWRVQPDNRFFCITEQKFLRNVPWVFLQGNQHFLPKLFVIPSFRTTLESLFPSRLVLTHVLRRSILPGDSVWQRVEQVREMQPDYAHRRLGIQIRYTDSQLEPLHLWEMRAQKCALENGMLPQHEQAAARSDLTRTSQSNSSTAESNPGDAQSVDDSAASASAVNHTTTVVFIASLYDTLERYLRSDYLQQPPANTGEQVTVVQLTSNHQQSLFSREEDEQALVEIILLSLSDDVIVSPRSSFGNVAHSYGALQPWVIASQDVIEGDLQQAGCLKAQSLEACYHTPERYLSCPHDPELHGSSVLELVPYIKDCLPGEYPDSIQLITDL